MAFLRELLPGSIANRILSPIALALCCFCPTSALAQDQPQIQSAGANTYTLRVTAREVIIELVARDANNKPVTDLKAEELQISEVTDPAKPLPRKLSSYRPVDPTTPEGRLASVYDPKVTLAVGCAVRTAFHYVLTYRLDAVAARPGVHKILITSTRPNVTLFYRRQYYIGQTTRPAKPLIKVGPDTDFSLHKAACYHSDTPSSFTINTHPVEAGEPDKLHYSVDIAPDFFPYVSLDDERHKISVDYGACTFDKAGNPLRYLHTSEDRTLATAEFDKAQVDGFTTLMNISKVGSPALIRFAIRDRETGNIAFKEVPVGTDAVSEDPSGQTFGTALVSADALCGDVFELPQNTTVKLPGYYDLDSVGAVYAHKLAIPYRLSTGIPGVTTRAEWFGIDYHGEFWIKKEGQYTFKLYSDDGAALYIDDEPLTSNDGLHYATTVQESIFLGAGRHTIHMPYFQGPENVALTLSIKGPGDADFKIFDTRDYPAPPLKTGVSGTPANAPAKK